MRADTVSFACACRLRRGGEVNADWLWKGFPVCVPRVDPASADDPLCPRKNRPVNSAGQVLSIMCVPPPPFPQLPVPAAGLG